MDVEGSFQLPGQAEYRTNLVSRARALLMLFLFSDVGPDDAPTRIRVASHLDVAKIRAGAGDDGLNSDDLSPVAIRATAHRDVALATGDAGDVYLCHPFLVHAAQAHRGREPRFMAQPPLSPRVPVEIDRPDAAYSPVELAIRLGLRSPHP